jgi:protein QN1
MKSEQLENFLNNKTETDKTAAHVDKKTYDLLEENYKEQEKLIKGYQQENERLYAELKLIKDQLKQDHKKFNDEINSLKCDLIQEKISSEKQLKQAVDSNNKILIDPKISSPDLVKRILPTTNESMPVLNTVNEYEAEIRLLNARIASLNELKDQMNKVNKTLADKNEFYAKNQRQIELDIHVLSAKNKEIKKLNEKLKLLESGKTPVDCLRQIKSLKNQLIEMESLVKRLKQPHSSAASVSLSIEFYEKKIEQLESQLKEKSLDLERLILIVFFIFIL